MPGSTRLAGAWDEFQRPTRTRCFVSNYQTTDNGVRLHLRYRSINFSFNSKTSTGIAIKIQPTDPTASLLYNAEPVLRRMSRPCNLRASIAVNCPK